MERLQEHYSFGNLSTHIPRLPRRIDELGIYSYYNTSEVCDICGASDHEHAGCPMKSWSIQQISDFFGNQTNLHFHNDNLEWSNHHDHPWNHHSENYLHSVGSSIMGDNQEYSIPSPLEYSFGPTQVQDQENGASSVLLDEAFEREEEEEKEEQRLEMELIEDRPKEGDSSLLLPTLVSQDLQKQGLVDLNMDEKPKIPKILGSNSASDEIFIEVKFDALILRSGDQVMACTEFNINDSPKIEEEWVKVDYLVEDEWYKVNFLDDGVSKEFDDKYLRSHFKEGGYPRHITTIEISFLWYRDGYSDHLLSSQANDYK